MYKNLTTICAAAVLALGLAACGGGGGSDNNQADGDTGTPPAPPPPANLTTSFAEAQGLNDDAVAAGKLATGAMESATENDDKLTTMEVAGDSSVAMQAAEDILQAQTDAGQAVTDAQKALDDAEAAKTAADDIDADHPQKAALLKAIDAAIAAAEKAVEDATAIRDGDDIKNAVNEVTGGEDADPQGTARSIANSVGMDIAGALQPTSPADGSGLREIHGQTAPADTIEDALKVEMNDRVGMTWAEIVGETQKMRIATTATDTNEVDAASIAGMALASVQTVTDRTTDEDAVEDDGLQVAATYKGIEGTAFCAGADCYVEAVADVGTSGEPGFVDNSGNRKFSGSWYFTPTSPMQDYVKNAAGTGYTPETLFATFGHWLTSAGDPLLWTVNTFATSTITDTGDLTTVNAAGDSLTDTSADYSGSAVGMSVLKTTNAAGDGQDIASGRFTADVSLTAEFGTGPMLGGYIHNFEGDAVGNWRVTLVKRAFTGALVSRRRDDLQRSQRRVGRYFLRRHHRTSRGHLRRLQRPLPRRACGRRVLDPEGRLVFRTGLPDPTVLRRAASRRPSFFRVQPPFRNPTKCDRTPAHPVPTGL